MLPLEEKIGYRFASPELLQEALTHPSLTSEKAGRIDNQRLEYLGDSVVGLAITTELYSRLADQGEGTLTKIRASVVCEDGLANAARRLKLGHYLQFGRGEDRAGGKERLSNLADAFESLAGAIYLDGGFEAASAFVLKNCHPEIEQALAAPQEINPKGTLQEILQADPQPAAPRYTITSATGPDHCKKFTAEVYWKKNHLGSGVGNTKRAAEVDAAIAALKSTLIQDMQGAGEAQREESS